MSRGHDGNIALLASSSTHRVIPFAAYYEAEETSAKKRNKV